MLRFGPRQKHQQQQAEPIDEVQNVSLMLGGLHQARREWQSAQERRTEHDTGRNLAYDPRLAQFYKEIAEQLGQAYQQKEHEK